MPGGDLVGVLTLRTLGDARAIREAVTRQGRIAIIGGGYIGLEVAAAARAHGAEVTIFEREDRVLARVASPQLSEILASYHAARGTTIVTDARVVELSGRDGHVSQVVLADGSRDDCDIVLVGVGAVPRDGLAVRAGLACAEGILVDERTRTDDPSILAIGDVTRRPLAGCGRLARLESIPSAIEQARQASATICGTTPVAAEVPWFWSDQFDLKLKIAGMLGPPAETVLRGDPRAGRFALFHHDAGLLATAETANSPADFMAARKFMAGRTRIDPVRLGDPAIPLRDSVVH
jgi:3-phenylpropionate/trans-cinnamate dioxygenase ferredoxin reductase subunit